MSAKARLDRLNAAERPRVQTNLRPRDAASIILIDNAGKQPRLLVGKRHPDQVFLPNKFVFPGGRVDPADTRVTCGDDLADLEREKLLLDMKGRASTGRARGLALAAIRELFEETGLVLGTAHDGSLSTSSQNWATFLAQGYAPRPSALKYFARAITPPRRPRRYDTRFFVAMANSIAVQAKDGDGELSDLNWLTFAQARSCDLHVMTQTILDEVEELLDKNARPKRRMTVPYYFEKNGKFQRTVLSASR